MRAKDPVDALAQEFACWYDADELSVDWHAYIPDMARGSAVRLGAVVAAERWPELVRLVRRAREDSTHPVAVALGDSMSADWGEEDMAPLWRQVQVLLGQLLQELPHAGPQPT